MCLRSSITDIFFFMIKFRETDNKISEFEIRTYLIFKSRKFVYDILYVHRQFWSQYPENTWHVNSKCQLLLQDQNVLYFTGRIINGRKCTEIWF